MILAVWSNVIPWHYAQLCLLERNIIIIKVSASLAYMFFPPSFIVLHIAVSKCRVYDVQCTRWLCVSNLSCYAPWWWSALRNISQGWVFCTRLVSLLREKCRKYYKVPTTRTANSLLPNTGFEGLVAEMLLGHTHCHLPDAHVAQLQQVCHILRSSLSLTWPVGLASEAVVWDSSSELLDGAGMKPKLEMLRRLLSSLVGSQQGMKAKEDLLLLTHLENKILCEKRERGFRGEPGEGHLYVSTLAGADLTGYVHTAAQQLV